MKRVLRKRIPREIKENLIRYASLFLMIALCMYIVIALVDAAEVVIRGTVKNQKDSRLEDGQFTVFTPLLAKQIKQIEDAGVTLESHASYDIDLEDGSVLRIFKNREKIDLVVLDVNGVNNDRTVYGDAPHLAGGSNEIVLEKRYCEEHGLSVGDHINIGKEPYLITGIGTTVDYDAPYRKLSDTACDSNAFGTAFVTADEYDRIRELNRVGSEELTYAFILNDAISSDDLKQMIKDFDFDYKKVDDPYYQEILDDTYGKKDEITDGIDDLVEGVDELFDGVKELKDGSIELVDGMEEIYDGSKDLYDGSKELYDGTVELKDGTVELKDGVDELKDGSTELNDGAGDMQNGAHSLWNGLAELKAGANELDDALHELEEYNGDITGGAEQIFDGVLNMAENSINAQLAPLGASQVSLSRDNYRETLDGVASMISVMGGDASDISRLKNSLDGIAEYVEGTKGYTEAVGKISSGASKLNSGALGAVDGASALESGASKLHEGTNELADGVSELQDGSKDLYDGAVELSDGAKELKDGAGDLNDGVKEAYDGSTELADGVDELFDGVEELRDGVKDLKKQSNDMMDEVFKKSPENIMEFMLVEDNLRIGGASGDIEINKTIGMVAGVIVLILFAYVLSVFVIHQIQSESSVIGALYALGVKKKDLMAHYITLPTLVSFFGGLTGAAVGLSGFGSSWQMSDSYEYYSIPWFGKTVPPYLIIYAVIMPPLVSLIINILVINKSLSRTALSLIRNEQKVTKSKDIKLGNMPFMRKYKIRQMLRERRTAFTVVAGMLISLLVFMLGMDCYVLCESVGRLSSEDTRYEYMYSYKYPTDDVPEGGEACFVQTLKKELYGYTLDVTVMGIDDDNPYIDVSPVKGKNKIISSDAVAARYNVSKGDKIILSDNANDLDYAFTVAEVVPYSVGLTVFMDIDSMRELFGEDEDYYNVVMSDHELDIDQGRLYSVTSKEDIDRSSNIFSDLMRPMVTMLLTMSAVIFCIVMYLMTAVMIDRAGFGISLLKIFGYNGSEIKKLYLDGNRAVIILGALIGIPVAKLIIDTIFPTFIANVGCCMHLEFSWYHYAILFAGIMICYTVISMLLTAKLNKFTPAEVLKNRE